jgi:transglutaminase-like putative cysteine protease
MTPEAEQVGRKVGMAPSGIPGVYAKQDALTDPGDLAALYDDLPDDPSALREVVSQLITHVAWAAHYGIPPGTAMPRDTQPVADRLKLIQSTCAGSLAVQRPPDKRTFGTCRDYALLLCSLLRHRAIPARVRCGFATYFSQRPYEDHWICEYWCAREQRWARADGQLDQLHRDRLSIRFDCADLPGGTFLAGGEAWTLARSGTVAAHEFGHGDATGLWFLRVNLNRDLLSLTNQQMSAWDTWRNATAAAKVVSDSDAVAADDMARAIAAAECDADGFNRLRALASNRQLPPW